MLLGAIVLIVRRRQRCGPDEVPTDGFLEHCHERIGIVVRKRPQQHRARRAEDRGIGAEDEGDGEDRHAGKCGRTAERAYGVTHVEPGALETVAPLNRARGPALREQHVAPLEREYQWKSDQRAQ